MHLRPSGLVTLTTDFGVRDPYVGILKGVAQRAAPKVQIVDVSHDVPPQDVATGAFFAWSLRGRFPRGTVHVCVVDPGVGTERPLLAAAACGDYWIAPDNGTLASVLADCDGDPSEVRAIDAEHLGLRREAATFDGRDVMGPAAALLATGRYGFSALGPRVEAFDGEDRVFGGDDRVVHVDRFGNLVTNVRGPRLGDGARVRLGDREVPLVRTYDDVPVGEVLAYVGSFGLLEVAVCQGDAASTLGSQVGAPIAVTTA